MATKILILVASSAIGGGPRHVFDLVTQIDKTRFDPVVVLPKGGPYFERLTRLGVAVYDVNLRSLSMVSLLKVIRIARQERVELIHSHGKGAGLYGRAAGAVLRLPVVHTFHGIHYRAYPRFGRVAYLSLERLLRRWTSMAIHVSEAEQAEALQLGLTPLERSTVIRNGIDLKNAVQSSVAVEMSDDFSWSRPVVIAIARMSPQKRLDVLLQAVALVRHRFPTLRCVVVGGASEGNDTKTNLEELVVRLGLREVVLFLGWREDVARLLQMADVFVTTSDWEGLPYAVLEAMAAGKVIVASDIPPHRELLEGGKCGLLFRAGDAEALAASLQRVLEDPLLQERLRKAARDRAKLFSVQRMVSDIEAVYEAVLRPARNRLPEGMAR